MWKFSALLHDWLRFCLVDCSRNVLQKNALDLDYNVLAYNMLEFPTKISLLNSSCFFNLFFFTRTLAIPSITFHSKTLLLLKDGKDEANTESWKGVFTVANYGPPTLILLNKNPPIPFCRLIFFFKDLCISHLWVINMNHGWKAVFTCPYC